jgi:hypothetical protein
VQEVGLQIADIAWSLLSQDGVEFVIGNQYRAFFSDAEPEVRLRIHVGVIPAIRVGEPIFEYDSYLLLYRDPDSWTVCMRSPASGAEPYQLAILRPDYLSGDVYCRSAGRDEGRLPSPLAYPFGELLMISLLSRGRGVELHACGIADGDTGLIFAGTSGAGKSTLARLWTSREGVEVLSDDRVIVRRQGGRFMVYGTPFHGDARLASPRGVPLERVFIIGHAPDNRLAPLAALDASARLLVRSFPTFWDAEGMDFTVGLLGEVAQQLPCYELGFVPDDRIVDFVRCLS